MPRTFKIKNRCPKCSYSHFTIYTDARNGGFIKIICVHCKEELMRGYFDGDDK